MLHGLHGGLHIGVPCEHDDGQLRVVGQERVERHDAVGIGQAQVEQHHIGRMLRRHLPPHGCGGGAARRVAEGFEELDEGAADGFVVVDDEDR